MAQREDAGFAHTLTRTNISRARIYLTVIFLLHVVLTALDISRISKAPLPSPTGYRYLFYLHLVLLGGIALLLVLDRLFPLSADRPVRPVHEFLWRAAVFLMLYVAAAVSSVDQLIHSQLTVFVMAAIGVAVGALMPWRLTLLLYTTSLILLLAGVTTFQDNPVILTGHVINAVLTVVIAVVATRILYRAAWNHYLQLQVIESQREELSRMASEDSLTGLHNRRYISECVRYELGRSRRYGRPLCVAMADLDFFKRINDSFSHKTGDEVLVAIAEILRASIRSTDFVSRYGGEEFVLVFPETPLASARVACENIRRSVETHEWKRIDPSVKVTISIGIAELRDEIEWTDLIEAADRQLYRAKRNGRNQVQPTE